MKVPTATQYQNWNDEKQAKADAMKGVRYYLPRPYLNLKQSTPVAQRTALVSFKWESLSNCYVLEGPDRLPTWVQKVAPKKISITQALALSLAGQPPGGAQLQKPGGEESGDAATGKDSGSGSTGNGGAAQGGPNSTATPRPPSELHARTGFLNSSDPVTRLGSRFDVVYLPDFEEQFVIRHHTGLGKVDIETQLRNGWAAEVFSQKVDNSNLIPYVINQFEDASEAAANIFTTWAPVAAGLPPKLGLPKVGKRGSEESGTVDGGTMQNFLGQIMLFKIAEVRIAQPGVYPILKPSEMRRLSLAGGATTLGPDPESSFDMLVQTAKAPWIRQDMAFIPCPPFTVIGFNTTSDVFIAPATERIALAGEMGDNTETQTGAKVPEAEALAKLQAAFFADAVKSKWGSEKDLIDYKQSKFSPSGSGADMEIKAASGQAFTKEQRANLKKTVLEFFRPDKRPLDVNVKLEPSANDVNPSPTLKLKFKSSLSELLSGL